MNSFIQSESVTYEKIGNNLLILHPKNAQAYECNEIVSIMWDFIKIEKNEDEIVFYLLENYEVQEKELRSDISAALNEMISKGLVLKK